MWQELYDAAIKVQNSRTISPFIDAGGVAAAILTKNGEYLCRRMYRYRINTWNVRREKRDCQHDHEW